MAEEKKENFWNKVANFLDKGVNASKKGLKNAGEAISNFGDKSVLKIELNQLKAKLDKAYISLGQISAERWSKTAGLRIVSSDKEAIALVADISSLKRDILRHEVAIEQGVSLDEVSVSNAEKITPQQESPASSSSLKKTASSRKTASAKSSSSAKTVLDETKKSKAKTAASSKSSTKKTAAKKSK